MNGQLPRVKKVLIAMKDANKSRGKMRSVVGRFRRNDAQIFQQLCVFCRVAYRSTNSLGYKGYAV
jgi:hypothetical protein